jgi:hypothetical protein
MPSSSSRLLSLLLFFFFSSLCSLFIFFFSSSSYFFFLMNGCGFSFSFFFSSSLLASGSVLILRCYFIILIFDGLDSRLLSKFSIQLYIVTYIETFFFDGHNTQLIYVSDRQKTGMRCEVPHVSLNSSHACIRTTSYQFSVFISNALQTQNRSR